MPTTHRKSSNNQPMRFSARQFRNEARSWLQMGNGWLHTLSLSAYRMISDIRQPTPRRRIIINRRPQASRCGPNRPHARDWGWTERSPVRFYPCNSSTQLDRPIRSNPNLPEHFWVSNDVDTQRPVGRANPKQIHWLACVERVAWQSTWCLTVYRTASCGKLLGRIGLQPTRCHY
jgi:hypothetical protein